MSAFIVPKSHIDALVTAAASNPRQISDDEGGLQWWAVFEPNLDAILREKGYQAYFAEVRSLRKTLAHRDNRRATEVGMMLWAENLASIHARYPDTRDTEQYPGPPDFSSSAVVTYRFRSTHPLPPVTILRALDCYELQACEHEGWHASEARSFCEALRHKMIRMLDGYRGAPWVLEERHVRHDHPATR